ncbi:subfamily B ATP-binding cassette protein HlyB/CyaB [Variovorax sp. SG517]|uniref:peptidase domain-containing ABC transporter n=1 Tax=Variovorax sp. SG517 TaxID=2587117 RepID=UPI00159E0AA8|nr:type I secretion system permease/ATPase [Variovorax sp. SG517]NVM87524.1 subfamily B ATP-binding cassette protein HlyB/CyaB [Variovorax sp. SG517]
MQQEPNEKERTSQQQASGEPVDPNLRSSAGRASFPARQGLSGLQPVIAFFSLEMSVQALGQAMGWRPESLIGFEDLQRAAHHLGLRSREEEVDLNLAPRRKLWPSRNKARGLAIPCLVVAPHGSVVTVVARRDVRPVSSAKETLHGAVASPQPTQDFLLWVPESSTFNWVSTTALTSEYGCDGVLSTLRFRQPLHLGLSERSSNRRFGLGWFIPILWRYRKPLGQVLLGAFLLQLVALTTPLFSQVIIDKVLMHKSLSTLHVLGIGMAGLIVFEAITNTLRGYMLAHTSARLDAGLSSDLFRHLLSLPIRYFEQRQAGDTLARTRELENIRGFFTGGALTTLVDGLFIGIFIAVMLLYSVKLTVVTLVGLPILALVTLVAQPIFARALQTKFDRGAEAGSFMVETIHGIHTVKSLALAPMWQRRWDLLAARQVAAGFDVSKLGNAAQSISQAVQRMLTLAVLWVGTTLVMDNELTVGGLIAFQMLAGQVLQPVSRLVGLWQNFQQVKLSVDRMGDLMNAQAEPSSSSAQAMPLVKGRVELQSISFRYQVDAPLVLRDVSLLLQPGDVVGIVGRSGCGKSTLTKLIQRLYGAESGRVLIDGHDIAHADPQQLRRQIGVVLQDSFLFSGTIAENIAVAHPGLAFDRIVFAAQQAGAHEFITALPQGYQTPVGERGTLLSGGQRQRIAIARALTGDPRILILDEATSALDVESEQAIQANMAQICRGRTVIMIAHRLSTLRHCSRIVVLDSGQVVEQGPLHDLLTQQGEFSRLWAMQQQEPMPVARKSPASVRPERHGSSAEAPL